MPFGEGTNFMSKRTNSGIATVRSVQIKIANSLVSGETCVDIGSHDNTIVLGN